MGDFYENARYSASISPAYGKSFPKAKREVNLNDQKIPLNRVLSHVTLSIFVYALRRKVSETAPKSI